MTWVPERDRLFAISLAVVLGSLAAGCGDPGETRPDATGTAMVAGYPAPPVTPKLSASRGGSATPPGIRRPTMTSAPTWTTEPTPDYPAALPPGAVVTPSAVRHWLTDRTSGRDLASVPYILDSEAGLAIVDVSALPPRRIWSLADAGLSPGRGVAKMVDLDLVEDGRSAAAVLVTSGESGELVALQYEADRVVVAERLSVPDASVVDDGASLNRIDLSGDGVGERILRSFYPPRAWFYAASDGSTGGDAGAARVPERAQVVADIEGPMQLIDLTGDGAFEVLTPEEAGRWRVHAWRDGDLEAVDTVTDTVAPAPPRTVEGALPPLTRDLFLWRDGQLEVARAAGGLVETVYAGPDDPGWAATETVRDGYLPGRPYAVSRDGRTLVVPERGCAEPGCTTTDYRFAVRDLATGRAANVAWPRNAADVDAWPSYREWDLSPDGRWLVFLERGAQPAGAENADGTIVAIDLAATPPSRHVLAACTPYDTGSEMHGVRACAPSLAISPDGTRVAYYGPDALRLVGLPGQPGCADRALVRHWFGEDEVEVRTYAPFEWSPDGRRLLVEVHYYEGSDYAVVDPDSGQLRAIPDSGEYDGPQSDLAWLPDANALVHARANGYTARSPLRLVTLSPAAAEGGAPTGAGTEEATEMELLAARNLNHGADLNAVAPIVAPDGSVRFVLRDIAGDAYRGNGLFSVKADGTNWTRLAALPTALADDSEDWRVYDEGLWTDDASMLLLLPSDTRWGPVDAGERVLLIAGDGSAVTDVGPVVQGGAWFTWTDPRTR